MTGTLLTGTPRSSRRGRSRRGVALLWVILLLVIVLSLLGIGLDFAGQGILTKTAGLTASSHSAHAAATELYPPDYTSLGTLLATDWPSQLQDAAARTTARDLAAVHVVGGTAELRDRNSTLIAPTDTTTLTVAVTNPTLHMPQLELNGGNDPAGDILLGQWQSGMGPDGFSPAVLPFDFQTLPLAVQVVVRRTGAPEVPGVSEGDNPVPFTFTRAMFLSDPTATAAEWRNRGLRVVSRSTVALLPLALAGQDASVPYAGGTAQVGVLPLALVNRAAVAAWLSANDPSVTVTLDIDNQGALDATAEAYFADHGVVAGDANASVMAMLSFLSGGGPATTRPVLRLADVIARPTLTAAEELARAGDLQTTFLETTWLVPLVRESDLAIVGFVRLYCVGGATNQVEVRLAPSASPRTGLTLRDPVDPVILAEFQTVLWNAGGDGPRPYGVACAPVLVSTQEVQR